MYTFRKLSPVIMLAVGVLTLAACSSGDTSSESAVESAESAVESAEETEVAQADAAVAQSVLDAVQSAKAVPSFVAQGEAFSIAEVKGKKIFEIPSVPNPFLQGISDAMKTAAEEAGAIYTICDTQGELAQWVACFDQAINSDQNLIVLSGAPDPRALQPQIQAADEAGIPVIVSHFYDDESAAPPACEGCEYLSASVTAPFNVAGKAAADWIIADSNGTANTLIVGGSDILPSPATIDTMTKEFDENCSGCTYTVINIPVADWNTKTQSEIQAALQANPDIKYIYVLYDAMVAGAVPAVETLGLTDVKIGSYNGSPFALDFIAQGDLVAFNVGEDTPGIGYATMDQGFRILTGNDPVVTRTSIRLWDDTNVSEAGVPAVSGTGYGDANIAGFKALWLP